MDEQQAASHCFLANPIAKRGKWGALRIGKMQGCEQSFAHDTANVLWMPLAQRLKFTLKKFAQSAGVFD
jgi:hypothetical protein